MMMTSISDGLKRKERGVRRKSRQRFDWNLPERCVYLKRTKLKADATMPVLLIEKFGVYVHPFSVLRFITNSRLLSRNCNCVKKYTF